MDVLLHEGEKERVLIREDNLSHAFTACIVVSDRTVQPVIKLNELNKPDRHRMLDKLRNDCDTASDYQHLFVKSAVQLFLLFMGANLCPPGEGIEGLFGTTATAGVDNVVFATWRCLCRTEHAYATEAIRIFVRKVCLRLRHTCVDSSVAIVKHAFANGHIYRLAANLWQRRRSFNALAAVKTATSIWASLPGGPNIDSIQEATLLHWHRCLVDVNQQYAMPLQAEPQFCTTTRKMSIIVLRLQLKARPEKRPIFSRFPKLTFGSGLQANDQLRRFSRISLSDS